MLVIPTVLHILNYCIAERNFNDRNIMICLPTVDDCENCPWHILQSADLGNLIHVSSKESGYKSPHLLACADTQPKLYFLVSIHKDRERKGGGGEGAECA